MTWRSALVAMLLGVVATWGVAMAVSMSPADAATLAAVASGSAVAAGLVGTALLFALRRRPIALQTSVVAVVSVGTVLTGAAVASAAMFLSIHDLHTLLVVLTAAGTVGVVVAIILAGTVSGAARSLGEVTRRIGDGNGQLAIAEPRARELAELAGDLEQMSRRLEDARSRERSLEASRRELIAWVSHDLRTPLAGIRAVAEALEDGIADDPETVARYYQTLRVEADRLATLVDELFELSTIQAGAHPLHRERISLGDLVSDAVSAAIPSAHAKGIRLEGTMVDHLDELELSPRDVSRALGNLLDNAIRHTRANGAVRVETGRDNGSAYVAVTDECGGIPEGDLSRVFEPAFRGEVARTPLSDGGAGLGLAIARGLVQAHRGEIDVTNQDGGCRFVVRLPLS
jgi:signal transduction histidine kinase